MVITVEICQIVSNITKKRPKILMLKLLKGQKTKESKSSKPTNYRNNIKKM